MTTRGSACIATVVPWRDCTGGLPRAPSRRDDSPYGTPDEVLSENGKQFTGRFGEPRAGEGAVRADPPAARASAEPLDQALTRGVDRDSCEARRRSR